MKFIRLLILLAALLEFSVSARADLASLFTNLTPVSAANERLPSFVFIQCHGLARGDLSCYGQTHYQTPNLDRLAAGGIRFTHYTGGTDSTATTAQLLAGKTGLATGEANLAERLQQNGYHTGLIGEWSLGGQPWRRGFDEFAGFLDDTEAQNYFPDTLWRFDPLYSFDQSSHQWNQLKPEDALHNAGPETIYPNTGGKKGQYLPELFINAMVNFVRVNEPEPANHYRPFFLLMNFPAPRTATTGADDFPVPSDAPFTDEKWPAAAKNRAALITRLDSGVGRLLEQLTKLRLTNDVMIVFTASSAPEKFANTNLNFLLPAGDFHNAKTSPLLPMIVSWPGKIPAGRVSDSEWTPVDFAPTALEIGHVKPAADLAGHSILPWLLGK